MNLLMYHYMKTQVNNLNDPTHSPGDFINNGFDHGILGKKRTHLLWESLSLSVFSSCMCLYCCCRYLPPVQPECYQRTTTMLWDLLLMARSTLQKTGGQDGGGRGKGDCKSQWGLVECWRWLSSLPSSWTKATTQAPLPLSCPYHTCCSRHFHCESHFQGWNLQKAMCCSDHLDSKM